MQAMSRNTSLDNVIYYMLGDNVTQYILLEFVLLCSILLYTFLGYIVRIYIYIYYDDIVFMLYYIAL